MNASIASRRILRAAIAACLAASLAVTGLSTSNAAPNRAELDAARERLQELEKDFEIVVEEYNLVNAEYESLQKQIAETSEKVATLEKHMVTTEDEAVAIAVQIYKSGGSTGSLEAVLSSKSLAEMDTSIEYLQTSQEAQAEVFERLDAANQELNVELDRLEEQRAKADEARDRVLALKAEIDEKIASQQDEIAELNEKIERAEARKRRREAAAARAAAEEAGRPAPPTPSSIPAPSSIPNVEATNPNAQRAVDAALSQIGKPYVYAAAGPDSYDCSGLTMWAWAQAGVSLPHNSGAQYAATPRIDSSDLEPGDLLFFGSPIHHVSMYIGNGQMVEAPYTGQYVRVVSIGRSDYVGAGRPGI